MNKIITTSVAILCLLASVNAQTLKQYKKAAQAAFVEQNYYEALANYQTVLQVDSTNAEARYNYAESARNFNAYSLAERNYEQVAISEQSPDFPLNNYWLASVKKNLGKYAESKMLFEKFLAANEGVDSEYTQRANNELEYLGWASEIVDTPNENMTIERLGDAVNTPYSEVSPMEVDGKLYYASHRFENEKDIHYPARPVAKILTSYEGNTGEQVEQLNVNKKHTANTTFNSDGSRIYYTICDYGEVADINCQIYSREKIGDDQWGESQRLPDYINTLGNTTTQPNIVMDEATGKETIYFVSDREGGKGGLDIWYSTIESDGNITEPTNLSSINTTGDDMTPFFHSVSQTLYFSSDGRKGLGGYDIYSAAKEEMTWAEVEHMGAPLNSSYNDLYYTINAEETKALFSSNRLGSTYIESYKEACCNDIYSVDIVPAALNLQALTFNKETGEELFGVDVQFIELGNILSTDKHDDNNQYDYEGIKNREYVFIASKKGFVSDTVIVSTMGVKPPEIPTGKLFLEPYKLNLKALTFDSKTKLELRGVKVKLVKCDEVDVDDKTNYNGNLFDFGRVNPEDCYRLVATRDGYNPATVTVKTDPLTGNLTLEKELFLTPKNVIPEIITLMLPFPIYFDNDEPDKKTMATTTSKSYDETVEAYLARRQTFKNKYGKGLRGEQRIAADSEIDNFFDNKVIRGATTMKDFGANLIEYIEKGNTAEIMIQGFASPLAPTKYNENLTKRRISSIRNYFRKADGARIESFINQGKLIVTEVPNGERLAEPGISDDYKDRKNSEYSPKASEERRVEIIDVRAGGF